MLTCETLYEICIYTVIKKIALQHAFQMLFYASDCKSKLWITFDKSYYSLNPV